MPAASALTVGLLGASLALSGSAPLLRLQDPALVESSGLAASARHDDVLWTHVDGGSVAEVRAVDASGETVATVTLAGIDPYDPEALAPGTVDGDPALFLGDIGDNEQARSDITVYAFAEPTSLADQVVRATSYRLRFPDGPHDAEALLVHPRTGRIYVATKGFAEAGLYRAPRDLATSGTNELVRVSGVPVLVTDGTFLPDGRFALRTYSSVYVYDRPGHQIAAGRLPPQPQGESLAFRGGQLLAGSEGLRSAVYAVDVPSSASPDRPAPVDSRPDREPAVGEDGWRQAYLVARAVAIVVILIGLIGLLRSRRRRRR
jgi:hypothetical protein